MSKQEIISTYPPLLLLPHFFDPPCTIKVIDASSSKNHLVATFYSMATCINKLLE